MANSCRLLNHVDPEGEYLKFYTELDSALSVGDKVFIIGGNYDNTTYTDMGSSDYNPFHPYAMGYTVISVDNTNKSNSVTLNIKYGEAKYSSGGVESVIFNPLTVYKTEEELLIQPNQVREAYVSKSHFKRGEFNSGKFQDGVFGEYNIQGESSGNVYQRQHFVDLLKERLFETDKQRYDAVDGYDYSTLESPATGNGAIFNNNYTTESAEFTNGVFLGGDWNWGRWSTRYNINRSGKKQTHTDAGLRLDTFADNNDGLGYSIFDTGNIGRTYHATHTMEYVQAENSLVLDYVPYEVRMAVDNGFTVELKSASARNFRPMEVERVEGTTIFFKQEKTYRITNSDTLFHIPQNVQDEKGVFVLECYVKSDNYFEGGRFLSPDWFGGVLASGSVEGGDWHSGEVREATLSSKYQRLNWYDGVFNGVRETSYGEDVRWHDGVWLGGNWKGDRNYSIRDFKITDTEIHIKVDAEHKHMFVVGDDVFVSYLRKSLNTSYYNNYTDLPDVSLINFQTFALKTILDSNDTDRYKQVTLVLDGKVDKISGINLKDAKVSQSHFRKGVWHDGVWESGLRKVDNHPVSAYELLDDKTHIRLTMDARTSVRIGDRVALTNINLIREVRTTLVDGFAAENREYLESLDYLMDVSAVSADGKTVTVALPKLASIIDDGDDLAEELVGIAPIDGNSITSLHDCVWLDGEFRSGAWRGGVWNGGVFTNTLYFDPSNTQHQSIWQSGYWKNGTFDNGVFLSGVWQNGLWKNGIMTNMFGNIDTNRLSGWDNGDSVWLNGVFENGTWKGGLWKNGRMLNGKILNGGMENIDWVSGEYDNGLGLYDSKVNVNRSGKVFENTQSYDMVSAPSLIYIDGDGWVQLDQPSFYQKDYNVIFQDLNNVNNPFDNQMFDVLERDKYGTRVRIDYGTGTYDNPLLDLDNFKKRNPVLAIDTLSDMCEALKTENSHQVWLLDSGHQRILVVDMVTKKVDVLGKVIGDQSKSAYNFKDLRNIASANTAESRFVYVVDGNSVVVIDKTTREMAQTSLVLDDEDIIDIWVTPGVVTIGETVFVLTTSGNIYYTVSGWETYKTVSLPQKGVYTALTGARIDNGSLVHIFTKMYGDAYSLVHNVLDYSVATQEYVLRNIQPSAIAKVEGALGSDVLGTFACVLESDSIRLWFTVEAGQANDVYVLTYRSHFNGNALTDEISLLNSEPLEYPIHKLKMGWGNTSLMVIGKDGENTPLYFAQSKLNKVNSGFNNPNSETKVMGIYQNLNDANAKHGYFYVDNTTDNINIVSKRIINVRESNEDLYNSDTDIDQLDNGVEVAKMINGGNETEVFSILEKGDVYTIRRTVFDTTKAITEYSIQGGGKIHDIAFTRNTLFVAVDDILTGKVRVVAFNNLNEPKVALTSMRYYSMELGLTVGASKVLLDVIEYRDNFVGILHTAGSGFHALYMGASGMGYKLYGNNLPGEVRDIALSNTDNAYSLFIAYDDRIVRVVTDATVAQSETSVLRWSKLDADSDVFYSGKGITEVYRNIDSTKLLIKYGVKFDVVDTKYKVNRVDVSESVIVKGNGVFALSNQMLIWFEDRNKMETYKHIAGKYRQRGQVSIDHTLTKNSLLNNAFALTYASEFNTDRNDYIFFVDNYDTAGKQYLRYYNMVSGDFNYAKPTDTLAGFNINDLSYDETARELYLLRDNTTFNRVKWGSGEFYDVETVTVTTKKYKKFVYANMLGKRYICALGKDNSVDILDITTTVNGAATVKTVIPASSAVVDDISFYQLNGVAKIYFVGNTQVKYTDVTLADAMTPSLWSVHKIIGEYENVSHITEYKDGVSHSLQVSDTRLRSVNILEAEVGGELTLNIKDFSFNPYNQYVSLYNESENIGKGIIHQEFNTPTVDIMASKLLANLSSATGFKKIVAVTNTMTYALFEDGLYKYNFTTSNVSKVSVGTLGVRYRDEAEPFPANILSYTYHPVDIALYKESATSIVVLFEIVKPDGARTGLYDLYTYNGNGFTKTGVEHLYANKKDAILSNGDMDSVRFGANTSNIGGVLHLFKSTVKPKIASIYSTFVLYFGTTTGAFLKVVKDVVKVTPLQVSTYSDLIYRVTLNELSSGVETVKSASLMDKTTNLSIGHTTAIHKGSYLIGDVDVLAGYDANTIVIVFDSTSVSVDETQAFTLKVNFEMKSTQIINSGSTVYDFKVFDNDGTDKIVVRQTVADKPINIDATFSQYWTMTDNKNDTYDITSDLTSDDKRLSIPLMSKSVVRIGIPAIENNAGARKMYLREMPDYTNTYAFETLGKGYKVYNTQSSQTLSPYLTSRVLHNTHIQNGVRFNENGSTYTAHVVSTRWKNRLFLGSWDAPFYHNHKIMEKSSVFLSGTFEGVFHDGFFLGGTFKNKEKTPSVVKQGHFSSDFKPIAFESGEVNSEYRYDILSARFEDNSLLLGVEAIDSTGRTYKNTVSDQLNKGRIVHMPLLFKKTEYSVIEITKSKISLDGKNNIVLKLEKPSYYNEELWLNRNIFIQTTEHAEYLFGESMVKEAYADDQYLYLLIESKFNAFTNGRYEPIIKPRIINNYYMRINEAKVSEVAGKHYTEVRLNMVVPSTFSTLESKLSFIQSYYLNDNIQIMNDGDFTSHVLIPDYLQLFTLSFNKTANNISVEFTSVAKNLYLSNIISKDNTSKVSVKLPSGKPGVFAHDIMVRNTYITTSPERKDDYLENNIFLSGKTDRNWVSGGWMNLDDKGFSNGISTFGGAAMATRNKFGGQYTKIVNIYFETNDYMWVELDEILIKTKPYRYIYLRGFTGSKSTVIGSERAKPFRVLEVKDNFVKINNPFRYFTGITGQSGDYFKNFNMDTSQLRRQTMVVKDTGARVDIASADTEKVFDYGYASISGWNGGDFDGEFNSVWNAGNFRGGVFNGVWFGSPENYCWQGITGIRLENNVAENTFYIVVNLDKVSVREHDLVYVKFNSVLHENALVDIIDGFYATVTKENDKLVLRRKTNKIIKEGSYGMNITRYRVNYTNNNPENYLITDYNSNMDGYDDVSKHLLLESVAAVSDTDKVITFRGDEYIATMDLVNLALKGNKQFSIDLWFRADHTETLNPLFGYHSSALENKAGFKCYINTGGLYIEHSGVNNEGSVEVELFDNIVAGKWLHLGLFYNNGVMKARLFDNDYDDALENTVSLRWDVLEHDVCFLGKSLFRVNTNITGVNFKGKVNEFRAWSTDVSEKFSLHDKKFINKYIPGLVAYYSGEDQLDYAAIYPEEEQYIVFNSQNRQTVVTNKLNEDYTYKSKNLLLSFDLFVDKGALVDTKVFTVTDTIAADSFKTTVSYGLELIIKDYGGDKFTLALQETVLGVTAQVALLLETDETFNYWDWMNITVTDRAVYVDGVKYAYHGARRNYFKYTNTSRIILGEYREVSATEAFNGLINKFNILSANSVDDDYVGYRIKSSEDTSRFSVGSMAERNKALSEVDSETLFIPYFNADGSHPLQPRIYINENYTRDIKGVVTGTVALQDSYVQTDLFTDYKFRKTGKLNTSMPKREWLSGNDFKKVYFGVQDYSNTDITSVNSQYVTLSVSGMDKFRFYGKSFSDANSVAPITVHKNGFITFDNALNALISQVGLYNDELNAPHHDVLSKLDSIRILQGVTRLDKGGYISYADRENEFVLKIYASMGESGYSQDEGAYNYVALRIDKVNSNILFYNRMIREVSKPAYTKYQGLNRSDSKVNYVIDGTNYHKSAYDKDFTVGYASQNSGIVSNDNTEYVLYVPRFDSVDIVDANIHHIKAKDYEAMSDIGLNVEYTFTGKNKAYYSYEVVEDMPHPLDMYYFDEVGEIKPYDAGRQQTVFNMREQYNLTHTENSVSRDSFFFGGVFNSDVWYNGIFVNGEIETDTLLWKYGIKYNGTIKPLSVFREFNAQMFTSSAGVELVRERVSDSGTVAMMRDKNAALTGVYFDLPAGTYKVRFLMKTDNVSTGENLVAIDLFVNSVSSHTGYDTVLNSDTLKNSDFDKVNTYQEFELTLTLKKDQKGIQSRISYVGTGGDTVTLDRIHVYSDRMESKPRLNWLGGFHNGSENSKVNSLLWYRGQWNGGIWEKGEWLSLDLENKYVADNGAINNAWSVWNRGEWHSTPDFVTSNVNNHSVTNHFSVWHGGTWNSALVSDSYKYTYENSVFKSHIVNNRLLQLPLVNSTWLGGLWLRGEWNGGIFTNGLWHSVSPVKAVDNNKFAFEPIAAHATPINAVVAHHGAFHAVSDGGKILTSSDGRVWEAVSTSNNTPANLHGISFIEEVGYAVGDSGNVFKSVKTGEWNPLVTGYSQKLTDVLFVDFMIGVICGVNTLSHTINGGVTWVPYTVNTKINKLAKAEKNGAVSVYAVGDKGKMYKFNLSTWKDVSFASLDVNLTDITFTDATNGHVIGTGGYYAHTTDGGGTWKTVTLPIAGHLKALHFKDRHNGCIVGDVLGADAFLLETNDGGITWHKASLGEVTVNDVSVEGERYVVATTDGQVLLNTVVSFSAYESKVGYVYDETYSTWNRGLMMNSVWEGGVVSENTDVADTVFGDLVGLYKLTPKAEINMDFAWDSQFEMKKTDIVSTYTSKKVMGLEMFIGYHNMNGALMPATDIEFERVKRQVNEDGIMSVYWKRGTWNNGIFQFSHWDNLTLDEQEVDTIAEDGNLSLFNKGVFYSSYWKGGLWVNQPSSSGYPYSQADQPMSLFYRSQWEKGYWKVSELGLQTDATDGIRVSDGLFMRSVWSAGVWEGGVFDTSIHRSGVRERYKLRYKGATIDLKKTVNQNDLTLSLNRDEVTIPTVTTIGRLSNDAGGGANLLNNLFDDNVQPLVVENKKYVLERRTNSITVYSVDDVTNTTPLKTISLSLDELYTEIFTTSGGSNQLDNLPSNVVTDLIQHNNDIWVGTDKGLWYMNLSTRNAYAFTTTSGANTGARLPHNTVSSVVVTATHAMVGTPGGLWVLDKNTMNAAVKTTATSVPSGSVRMPSSNVKTLFQFEGNLYVGTDSGLWVMNIQSGASKLMNKTYYDYSGADLPSPVITAFYMSDVHMWVGTDSGMWLLNLTTTPLVSQVFETNDTEDNNTGQNIPHNHVVSIEQKGDTVFIGTKGGVWKITQE